MSKLSKLYTILSTNTENGSCEVILQFGSLTDRSAINYFDSVIYRKHQFKYELLTSYKGKIRVVKEVYGVPFY